MIIIRGVRDEGMLAWMVVGGLNQGPACWLWSDQPEGEMEERSLAI